LFIWLIASINIDWDNFLAVFWSIKEAFVPIYEYKIV